MELWTRRYVSKLTGVEVSTGEGTSMRTYLAIPLKGLVVGSSSLSVSKLAQDLAIVL